MNRLLLVLPALACACAATEQAPHLHVLQAKWDSSALTLKLAALADKNLHEQCLRYIENPPEPDEPEEDPARYIQEKEWAQEEGGYLLVGRSCVTGVKADLKLTDASGTVYTPTETEIQEENGVLLATLTFDLPNNSPLPVLDALSISGSVEYAAHYNMESELTAPVEFSLPCELRIGDYVVNMRTPLTTYTEEEEQEAEEIPETYLEETNEEEYEEEVDAEEEEEEYDESFYAEENEDKEMTTDMPSGYIEITPIHKGKDLRALITNIIIYDTSDEEKPGISGTFGNGDMERCFWEFICKENVLPQQGKISLRLRKKAHPRRYQFQEKLQLLNTK